MESNLLNNSECWGLPKQNDLSEARANWQYLAQMVGVGGIGFVVGKK